MVITRTPLPHRRRPVSALICKATSTTAADTAFSTGLPPATISYFTARNIRLDSESSKLLILSPHNDTITDLEDVLGAPMLNVPLRFSHTHLAVPNHNRRKYIVLLTDSVRRNSDTIMRINGLKRGKGTMDVEFLFLELGLGFFFNTIAQCSKNFKRLRLVSHKCSGSFFTWCGPFLECFILPKCTGDKCRVEAVATIVPYQMFREKFGIFRTSSGPEIECCNFFLIEDPERCLISLAVKQGQERGDNSLCMAEITHKSTKRVDCEGKKEKAWEKRKERDMRWTQFATTGFLLQDLLGISLGG